jgi:hypothetical protein
MLTERKIRAAFDAWIAERCARQALEPSSETATRVRGHYRRRIRAGIVAEDPAALAEALIELQQLILEEARICRWQLPRFDETISRITVPLQAPSTHAADC